jgi:hypothetical protein
MSEPRAPRGSRRRKVLIVDYDPVAEGSVDRLLIIAGHDVHVERSLPEAREACRTCRFDVALAGPAQTNGDAQPVQRIDPRRFKEHDLVRLSRPGWHHTGPTPITAPVHHLFTTDPPFEDLLAQV